MFLLFSNNLVCIFYIHLVAGQGNLYETPFVCTTAALQPIWLLERDFGRLSIFYYLDPIQILLMNVYSKEV